MFRYYPARFVIKNIFPNLSHGDFPLRNLFTLTSESLRTVYHLRAFHPWREKPRGAWYQASSAKHEAI